MSAEAKVSSYRQGDALLDHYESFLGPCSRHWINDPQNAQDSLADVSGLQADDLYQVLQFDNQPAFGASVFITYGISRHVLQAFDRKTGERRSVRMEAMVCVKEGFSGGAMAYLLMSLGNAMLRRREAPINGEVIDWRAPVFEDQRFTSIYCTEPLLFPEDFGTFSLTSPETVICWIIPVTAWEASLVEKVGFQAFNELLEKSGNCILKYDRRSEVRYTG